MSGHRRRRKARLWMNSPRSLAAIERQLFGYSVASKSPGRIKSVVVLGNMAPLWLVPFLVPVKGGPERIRLNLVKGLLSIWPDSSVVCY